MDSQASRCLLVASMDSQASRCLLLAQPLHRLLVSGTHNLQRLIAPCLFLCPALSLCLVPLLQRLSLGGHGVRDRGEDGVGLVQLLREGVPPASLKLGQPRVAGLQRIRACGRRLRDLDGQEEREEVPDAEAAAARLDGLWAARSVFALGADTLDEFKEARLLAVRPLQ